VGGVRQGRMVLQVQGGLSAAKDHRDRKGHLAVAEGRAPKVPQARKDLQALQERMQPEGMVAWASKGLLAKLSLALGGARALVVHEALLDIKDR